MKAFIHPAHTKPTVPQSNLTKFGLMNIRDVTIGLLGFGLSAVTRKTHGRSVVIYVSENSIYVASHDVKGF